MLAFGELLKISDLADPSPAKVALGQSIQFFSIIFLGFALISFISACFRNFFSEKPTRKEPAPEFNPVDRPQPAPPPLVRKRKYTERDFMPAALRAELETKETQAESAPISKSLPPPSSDKSNSGTPESIIE